MQKTIDINLIKEDPKLFFSQLPEKAEVEITEFLRFIVFKYNINRVIPEDKKNDLLDAFASLRTGLPNNFKFNREEANER
ncbi:MAG: hypothetical protein B6D64_14370 [Bacteroidetes bacterium 4484_276]|nr:MAG: hypothetical protein B6D64_14370 [Bacteroidetes bacterium 4484_276]